jgi:hypothetical protein
LVTFLLVPKVRFGSKQSISERSWLGTLHQLKYRDHTMNGPFATRLFRIVFILAGCYNLTFGLWAGFWPLQFFEIFSLQPPHYPAIWSCLGMVVGVYGLLYWYVAWKPERGRPIIAIGLLGKVLGPIGMACSISELWPARLAMLNVYNDVVWWLPFTLFLIRGTPLARRMSAWPPWCCAATSILAYVAMGLLLRPGLLPPDSVLPRATYIAQNPSLWSLGWIALILADFGVIPFYAWWAAQLKHRCIATCAVLLAMLAFVCDLSGESISLLLLHERSLPALIDPSQFDSAAFLHVERIAALLTGGAANFFYTACGILLLLVTPNVPQPIRLLVWIAWLAGLLMTLAACTNWIAGIVIANIVLFPLLIFWTVWMALRWRPS